MSPIPPMLGDLRVPACFARDARLEKAEGGSLRTADIVLWEASAPPSGPITAFIRDGGVWHYFHFMEAMIWLAALQHSFLPQTRLARIVFAYPWDNPGQNHVQRAVLDALYPGVEIADPGWAYPVRYEKLLVIDRDWRDTRLNKFLEAGLGIAARPARAMGQHVRAAVGAARAPPAGLRILHVKRPPPRCLGAEAEADLLALLSGFGTVTDCDFASIPWAQQVRLAAAHDVMAGVHGNGLTNAAWMRPGGLVLEFFPDGVRHYDYQFIAELCGLGYAGFERNAVFHAGDRTGPPYGHQEPTNQPVTRVPRANLERVLGAYAAKSWAASTHAP